MTVVWYCCSQYICHDLAPFSSDMSAVGDMNISRPHAIFKLGCTFPNGAAKGDLGPVPIWYHHPSWVMGSQVDSSNHNCSLLVLSCLSSDHLWSDLTVPLCKWTCTSVTLIKTKCLVVFYLLELGHTSISDEETMGSSFSSQCNRRMHSQGVCSEREAERDGMRENEKGFF